MKRSLKSSKCTSTSKNRKIGKPYSGISLTIVSEEKALKRGAEAGWALGQALKECIPESNTAIKAAIAALTLLLTTTAEAHCYSHWYYPYPQHCGRGETGRHMGLKIPQRYAMRVQPPPSAPTTENEDHDWYVEITKVPTDDNVDADLREVGVEKLKQQLK